MYDQKYRPSNFDDVVGNVKVVDAIKNSLDSGIGCKSMLLTGGFGCGKTTLARIVSMKLLGKAKPDELEKDFYYKEINCSIFNGIDYIRNHVLNILSYSTLTGGNRVFFFDECAGLSHDAQRALLKTIDYAKNYDYFIFATNEIAKINKALLQLPPL